LGLLATGLGALAAFASQGRLDPTGPVHLYYPLFLFAVAGAVAVGFSDDLFTLFVMVEVSALPSYALVAYRWREEPRAVSAAIKYLLQGVTGTVTALFGVGLLYVLGGTLRISELAAALAGTEPSWVALGAGLVLIGYGVKLAVVPMHTWLPDAYVHAPAGVTAILAGATKAGALVALFRSFVALPGDVLAPATLGLAVSLLAVLTMTVGNLLALNQRDLRRMLAYSSVAQMGYILLGFGVGLQYGVALGFAAGLFYAVAYGVMKGGAFLAADAFVGAAGTAETARMRGLGARHPALGLAFTVFILGLVGVPATAGFPGKLLIFQAGMDSLELGGVFLALALAANSALSLGYYVPVLSTLLFQGREPAAARDGRIPSSTAASVVALAAVTVALGLVPHLVFGWVGEAARMLSPGGGP
ncbi:MAG: hypothetical protein A3K68_04420, partial [Euryarchaeota archaeon RBG_16_68_13]